MNYTEKELRRRDALCLECTDSSCAYNDTGLCAFALVHGNAPKITEEDGCLNGVYAEQEGSYDTRTV